MSEKPYVAQVIIEKGFASREAAENFNARLKNKYEPTADNVETHLWEPVKAGSNKVKED